MTRGLISCLCLLFFLLITSPSRGFDVSDDTGKSEEKTKKIRFEVLPGRGWDNLRNLEMGQVFASNYSKWEESDDGFFIVPSTVKLLPRKASRLQRFSDVFTSYEKYTSLTAASINTEGHGDFDGKVEVSGSYSSEYQKVKVTQINTRSVTTRVQMRHTVYTAVQEAESPLTPAFRNRLLDLAYELQANNTKVVDYLADMIIADYGTHFITAVDAGAVFANVDFIRSGDKTLTDTRLFNLKAGAALNFEKLAGMNRTIGVTHSKKEMEEYVGNITDSLFISVGGPPMTPSVTADSWARNIMRNLVAVDRRGDPLFYAVNMQTLGSLSSHLVAEVRRRVRTGVERYYHANTVIGCMKRDSENFNMVANVPSHNCKAPAYNHTFGGVYQTCHGDQGLCQEVTVDNPMSGGPICSKGYRAVHLWSRVHRCRAECAGWWVFKRCENMCAIYDLFWCASMPVATSDSKGHSGHHQQPNPKQAYLFGGIYNNIQRNPMTGSQSCPAAYYAMAMGSSGLKVCVSRDFELGSAHAFEFGGFFSCNSGNPYTLVSDTGVDSIADFLLHQNPNKWPKRCPAGFAQHLADIDGACEIMYCIRNHALASISTVQVQRPPFTRIPDGMVPNPPRQPNAIAFSVDAGRQWSRDPATSEWSFAAADEASWRDRGGSGVLLPVLGSVLGTVCLGMAIAAVVLLNQRQRNFRRLREEAGGLDNPNFGGAGGRPADEESEVTTRAAGGDGMSEV